MQVPIPNRDGRHLPMCVRTQERSLTIIHPWQWQSFPAYTLLVSGGQAPRGISFHPREMLGYLLLDQSL